MNSTRHGGRTHKNENGLPDELPGSWLMAVGYGVPSHKIPYDESGEGAKSGKCL